jgi:alkylation response protein AidB-like acyl-CoA dehydrogenase
VNELRESARKVLDGLGLGAKEEKSWPLAVELGWLLVSVPESLGGLEQGFAGACAIQQELGRSLAAAPVMSATLAIEAIAHSELTDREKWIERLTTGDYIGTPLAGESSAVPSADKATHVLRITSNVVALVPKDQVKLTPRATWDETRRLFDVEFKGDGVALAKGAAAAGLGRRIHTARDFLIAADCVGGAEALLEKSVEYLQTRKQFGRPLALFQALKHRCADLKTMIGAAEALLLDGLETQSELKGRAAKQLACSAYAKVAEEALQLHGGIGMTAEHHCHLFLKRALLNEQLGRGNAADELALADALLKSAA